ncbi:DUF1801 domain-containing protein [Phaeodactylibacter sp.]|uniref:DUF1801 domain-containing protein n=1 Tax=Phaeodactylibacter sp. TaxID=1940289 RepID=UPI0025EB75B6|nr:DUF1801 domain-containing protein [Phaeodactylibacter sp.]MCI4647943.1 DUF1801 domain-containing protein [Phaeodactylibacter sp.]MCI5089668.1 DUF1801 domain-containing protein [Phaeodactylibacter sp.]
MAKQKTLPTDQSVQEYLNQLEDEQKKADSYELLKIMQEVTGQAAAMWGSSIIGFGRYHYRYDSGHEGFSFLTGFAPRKRQFSIYIMSGFSRYESLMEKLGNYKTGKSCLYVKRLSDVDPLVLRELIAESVAYMKMQYPDQG